MPLNEFFMLSKDSIVVGGDGYLHFLRRLTNKIQKYNPVLGDTVRCLYHEDKTCTGFVIQGTRKTGKVIHVKPANKNVPLEIDEK
jgi:hypothetical protein